MTRHPSPLPRLLGLAALTAATGWFTLLSWRGLTTHAAQVLGPLFFLAALVAVTGALGRWLRWPGALLVAAHLLLGAAIVLGATTGSIAPTPDNLGDFVAAFRDGITSAQAFRAPIPTTVPPIHAMLLTGGALVLVLLDLLAGTLRRVPLAGLVLLAAYALPVAVTGRGVSWWTFIAVAAGFMAMLFAAHGEQVSRWGRGLGAEADVDSGDGTGADPTGFGVRTGAVRGSALAIGTTATGLALFLPLVVPTLSVSLLDGAGPGKREIQVSDPMLDLRRDLVRGDDVPLVWISSPHTKPTYVRLAALTRFNGDTWTPGDRDIPETQVARGAMPALDGVSLDTPRRQSPYNVRVSPDFASTWLPTTELVSRVSAIGDWRYDLSTMDFMTTDPDVTTAGMSYSFTGVDLELDPAKLDRAVSGAANVRSKYLEVPSSVSSDIRTLTAAVTGQAETRFRKARALQQWFREDGGFRYSLDAVAGAEEGGLDSFLDESGRVGYCEQFAASMAVMARILGIPARVAVGFLEPRPAGPSQWEFSAWDLHAWPELYFPGSGWVRFEPTPGSRAPAVPSYTEGQIDTGTAPSASPSASRGTDLLPDRGAQRPAADAGTDDGGSATPWVAIAAGSGTLVLLALAALLPHVVRRRRRERRLGGDIEDAWAELADLATDLGHPWPGGRSPRRTGAWLGRRFGAPVDRAARSDRPRQGRDLAPEGAAALDRLVLDLERARYARAATPRTGGHGPDVEAVERALLDGVSPRTARRSRWWPRSLRPRPYPPAGEVVTLDHDHAH